jgi:hypothetical protein
MQVFFELTVGQMILGDSVVVIEFQTGEGGMLDFRALVLRFCGSNMMMVIWGLLGSMGWYDRECVYSAMGWRCL